MFGISTHLYVGDRLDREHLVEIAAHGFDAVEVFALRSHFDDRDRRAAIALAEWLDDTRRVARKSLVAARALRAGEELVKDAVAVKRPGTGISPAELERALGRRVRRDLAADDVIDWTALE